MSFDPFEPGSRTGFAGTLAAAGPAAAADPEGPEVASGVIDFGAPARHVGVDAYVDADPAPAGSLQTLANYLSSGYWQDTGRAGRYFDIAANGGTLQYNLSWSMDDSNGLTAARKTLAREAFKLYEEVLGIDFVETTSTNENVVDFFLQDNDDGAWHSGETKNGEGGPIAFAQINVEVDWDDGSNHIGSRTFQTFLHEIGHGLGLGHQGEYNGNGSYEDDAMWANDSWQLSMMSYFDQEENPTTGASFAELLSPMAADYLALNKIYASHGHGVSHAFNGNTIWGFNTNISSTVSAAYADLAALADTNAFCIVDGSGVDTVDFSGFSDDQAIKLAVPASGSTKGSISSVGGLTGNMTIAVGTVIENVVSGEGDDTITGNNANNNITAGAGNDRVLGGAGDDTLKGGDNRDQMCGGAGQDVFDYDFVSESKPGSANFDVLMAGGGGLAFDGAGSAAGDRFDFVDLGDLTWGGTGLGSIYLRNLSSVTHCYVNIDDDAPAELDIAIVDGAVLAGAYTAADFDFV